MAGDGLGPEQLALPLSSVTLDVRMKSCRSAEDCDIIGEGSVWISGRVPLGQVRYLDEMASGLYGVPGAGSWEYTISEIVARKN